MIDINFRCSNENIQADLMETVRAFSAFVRSSDDGALITLDIVEEQKDAQITLNCYEINGDLKYTYKNGVNLEHCIDIFQRKSLIKRCAKVILYDYLKSLCSHDLPYGALTGIRPTKLYHDLVAGGKDAYGYMIKDMRVSPDKADLIREIVGMQEGIYNCEDKCIDLFVNIPFCTSRCSYCSFIAAEIGKVRKFIPDYIQTLIGEIRSAKKVISDNSYILRSVYVGGGTPTSLPDEDFTAVMKELAGLDCEFTVEAGRPDTITDNKLHIMDDMGVTRISVNPQSFNDKTLMLIGRKHFVSEIYEAFALARKYDFDINTDLIAMLPGEGLEDFKYSVDCALSLAPENITVHTLALKKGSRLKEEGYDNTSESVAAAMVDYARSAVSAQEYRPYYMYRQKYMSGNLENVGYCKSGKQCVYNIDIMEECSNIIACGAGAISKRLYPEQGRIERLANPKGLDVYLQRRDTLSADKERFFAY